jgi:hypothetical protein
MGSDVDPGWPSGISRIRVLMGPPVLPYILGPLGILCLLAGGWITVCFLISRLGWAPFARSYASSVQPSGPSFTASQASFGHGFDSYRNVLRVTFMPQGIHVRAISLFQVGHRPLLLPWQGLESAEVKRSLFGLHLLIKVRGETGYLNMTLPAGAQASLEAARAS